MIETGHCQTYRWYIRRALECQVRLVIRQTGIQSAEKTAIHGESHEMVYIRRVRGPLGPVDVPSKH